jgi:hypothetical protein
MQLASMGSIERQIYDTPKNRTAVGKNTLFGKAKSLSSFFFMFVMARILSFPFRRQPPEFPEFVKPRSVFYDTLAR